MTRLCNRLNFVVNGGHSTSKISILCGSDTGFVKFKSGIKVNFVEDLNLVLISKRRRKVDSVCGLVAQVSDLEMYS